MVILADGAIRVYDRDVVVFVLVFLVRPAGLRRFLEVHHDTFPGGADGRPLRHGKIDGILVLAPVAPAALVPLADTMGLAFPEREAVASLVRMPGIHGAFGPMEAVAPPAGLAGVDNGYSGGLKLRIAAIRGRLRNETRNLGVLHTDHQGHRHVVSPEILDDEADVRRGRDPLHPHGIAIAGGLAGRHERKRDQQHEDGYPAHTRNSRGGIIRSHAPIRHFPMHSRGHHIHR